MSELYYAGFFCGFLGKKCSAKVLNSSADLIIKSLVVNRVRLYIVHSIEEVAPLILFLRHPSFKKHLHSFD